MGFCSLLLHPSFTLKFSVSVFASHFFKLCYSSASSWQMLGYKSASLMQTVAWWPQFEWLLSASSQPVGESTFFPSNWWFPGFCDLCDWMVSIHTLWFIAVQYCAQGYFPPEPQPTYCCTSCQSQVPVRFCF